MYHRCPVCGFVSPWESMLELHDVDQCMIDHTLRHNKTVGKLQKKKAEKATEILEKRRKKS